MHLHACKNAKPLKKIWASMTEVILSVPIFFLGRGNDPKSMPKWKISDLTNVLHAIGTV